MSEQLGLRLQAEGSQLMFYRLDTGERLLTAEETLHTAEESLQSEVAGGVPPKPRSPDSAKNSAARRRHTMNWSIPM